MGSAPGESGVNIIAKNRKAFNEYEILERWEAGIVLQGTEVKSLRAGRCNMGDAFGDFRKGEVWLCKLHIGPYEQGNRENHEPFRRRKLLFTARELRKMKPKLEAKGLALVPLKLYFKRGLVKVEMGLGRGKKQHDKRRAKAKRDSDMRIRREMGRG